MTTRRGFITSLIAFTATAPAIVRAGSLMPVKMIPLAVEPTGIAFADMLATERKLIDNTFLVSLFETLNKNPDMTASQIIEMQAFGSWDR